MTEEEYLAKFDDRHQTHFYAVGLLDGDGEDDRRTARICASVNTAVMNALRLHGINVEDSSYHSENEYMPSHNREKRKIKPQSWDEIKGNMGF